MGRLAPSRRQAIYIYLRFLSERSEIRNLGNNGYKKTQYRRCVDGVEGFAGYQGKKENRDFYCSIALAETQSKFNSFEFLFPCLLAIKELNDCDEKSNIWGINK